MANQILIDQSGRLTFIYSDDLEPLLEIGGATVKRASHVEPADGGGWLADMRPIAGETGPVLGPYRLRAEALAAEVAWIEANVLAVA